VGLIEAHQQLWLLRITHLGELFIVLGDGGPQRMILFAQHIPEFHRAGGDGGQLQSQQFTSLAEHRLFLASGGQAGEVALHLGQQGGHTDPADLLHQALQGHRLAGASSAGDQAVTVGEGRQQATVHRARGVSAGGRPGDQQGLDGDGGGSLLGRSVGVVNG
jgi:hypothetical protein